MNHKFTAMNTLDESLAALDRIFKTADKSEINRIFKEVDEMQFEGPTVSEYFSSFEKGYSNILLT